MRSGRVLILMVGLTVLPRAFASEPPSPLPPALAHPKPLPQDPAADAFYRKGFRAFKAKDYKQAYPDLIQAARGNNPKALDVLGRMFEEGLGVPKEPGKAFTLYERAAQQGYRAAQLHLGTLYELGKGAPKDPSMAAALRRLAAGQAPKSTAVVLPPLTTTPTRSPGTGR